MTTANEALQQRPSSLCEQILREKDPIRQGHLVEQLYAMLEEREQQLFAKPLPPNRP